MLVIRLRRIGKKNKPTYRVVVAENSFPVNGKFTADLGFYNPHTKAHNLKTDEVTVWLNKGAQPSNAIAKILVKEKVKHGSVIVHKRNRPAKDAAEATAPKSAPAPAAEVPAAAAEAEPTAEQTPSDKVAEAEATPTETA